MFFFYFLFLYTRRYEPAEGSVPAATVKQSKYNSLWSAGHLNKALICYPETAVNIYQDTPSQHPRKSKISTTKRRKTENPSKYSLFLHGSFYMFKLIKVKIRMGFISHRKQTATPRRDRPFKAVKERFAGCLEHGSKFIKNIICEEDTRLAIWGVKKIHGLQNEALRRYTACNMRR